MHQHDPQKWFNLEEHFFGKVDQQLLQHLRDDLATAKTAEAIAKVTGITNSDLANAIAGLDVTVETLAAFRLAPLVAVAWADDRIEAEERYAITQAARASGISADEPAMKLLEAWTTKRPAAELLDAWCEYAKVLSGTLAEEHRETLKKEMVTQIHAVAEASGGVLGFGSVSSSEKATIERIEAALS